MKRKCLIAALALALMVLAISCRGEDTTPPITPPPETGLVWDQGNWDQKNWQ